MKLNELLLLLNSNLKNDKRITEEQLITILLDVSRILDKEITKQINDLKKKYSIKVTSSQKEYLRKKLLGYNVDDSIIQNITGKQAVKLSTLHNTLPNKSFLINSALETINVGLQRNRDKMIQSLIARFNNMYLNIGKDAKDYIDYLHHLQLNLNQLSILEVHGKSLNSSKIAEIINHEYDNLSNYHYMIILFKDTIQDKVKWLTISEVAIYMEHLKKEHNFTLFEKKNKKLKIDKMTAFIKENKHITLDKELIDAITEFYNGVDYGFHFEDLLISSDGSQKVLVMQKIELDETPKKCPACHEEIVRSNSFVRTLYKSFECQNPSCPSRSKIGRGKRFELFAAKRQIMLERNSPQDKIPNDVYKNFRRDILTSNSINIEDLIRLYSWEGDTVNLINSCLKEKNYLGRKITNYGYEEKGTTSQFDLLKSLELKKLFTLINDKIHFNSNYKVDGINTIRDSIIVNGNSTELISFIRDIITTIEPSESFLGAITSPPYYNAREYSQWSNLLLYLCDMMINARGLFHVLDGKNTTYIYNIGDIVGQDNIYSDSSMSKRRQMLGFYSVFIFSIVGFELTGNIIWDKGEVQSKRNSTSNHVSGYLKPINAYEHCLVFQKQQTNNDLTKIVRIGPVKKINSKGNNTFGHTAPYPIELIKIIYPFIKQTDGYIIDPFLGSGTTIISLMQDGYKAIGFELNETYYKLALRKIKESIE